MKRSRVPGPIQATAQIGTSEDLQRDGSGRWISLDPLSSGWTLNDPGSTGTINAASVSEAGVRFQLELDNNGERWNAGAQTGPRYYKKLEGAHGPILWSHKFSIEILIWRTAVGANSGSGNQEGAGVVVGIADSSCVSDTSDVEHISLGCYNNIAANEAVKIQIGGDTAVSYETDSDTRRAYAWIGPAVDNTDADGHPMIHKCSVYCLDANNRIVESDDPTKQVHEYVGTDPVYLFCAPTFYSASAPGGATDTDTTWKIWYRISQSGDADGFTPIYIPNGGASE